MRLALVLPALPFECDVSGCPTDHLLDRALQPLSLVPGLVGATHGLSSSVWSRRGDYPVSVTDNPLGRCVPEGGGLWQRPADRAAPLFGKSPVQERFWGCQQERD